MRSIYQFGQQVYSIPSIHHARWIIYYYIHTACYRQLLFDSHPTAAVGLSLRSPIRPST